MKGFDNHIEVDLSTTLRFSRDDMGEIAAMRYVPMASTLHFDNDNPPAQDWGLYHLYFAPWAFPLCFNIRCGITKSPFRRLLNKWIAAPKAFSASVEMAPPSAWPRG
jgi:hypothetical protein